MGRLGLSAVFFFLFLLCLPLVLMNTYGLPARTLGAWISLSAFMLCVAYASVNADLLGKRVDGRLSMRSWALFGPYLALSLSLLHLHRVLGREPSFHEIGPGLFLGRMPSRRDARLLRERGVVGVLDLTAEFTEIKELRVLPGYRCLPLLDMTAPSPEQLRIGCDHIRDQRARGGVLVHCASGHGRSATLVIAHLVASGTCASAEEALARVKKRRPGVALNHAQRRLLAESERGLRA